MVIGTMEDVVFFPYNSEEDDYGQPDRLYDSQDFADYFRQFIGNGVYPNPSNGLRVESQHSSMVLTVPVGAGFINGRLYIQKKDFDFTVNPSHATLGRRDIVICRHDIINRTALIHYIAGIPASIPLVPAITRTDDIFDLKLCEITINPNAQSITQANILDTRMNADVCGIVHGIIDQVDTSSIFIQYKTYLDEQIALWESIRNTQELNWKNQTIRQESDWKAQTENQEKFWGNQTGKQEVVWQEQTDQQEQMFRELFVELRNTYHMLETLSFTLINNNFDDWSVRRGCKKTTTFLEDGNIKEVIVIILISFILAEKMTIFNADGSITETVVFYPYTFTEGDLTISTAERRINKQTVFNADGNITEAIT